MWAIQCKLDKMIIFSSFLVVLIICVVLLTEQGEDYTQWLREKVGEVGGVESLELEKVTIL